MNGPRRNPLYMQSYVATGCKRLASAPSLLLRSKTASFHNGGFISRAVVCLITEESGLWQECIHLLYRQPRSLLSLMSPSPSLHFVKPSVGREGRQAV